MIGRPWLGAGLATCAALTAGAAQASYRAEQVGKVVRLTDTGSDTVVSFVPSVGNMAFEMRVKGHNVLYFPFESVDAHRRGPGGTRSWPPGPTASTNPPSTPTDSATPSTWSSATCAGRPRSTACSPGPRVGHRRDRGGRELGLGHEPPRVLPISSLGEAVPVRPHHRDDHRLKDGVLECTRASVT